MKTYYAECTVSFTDNSDVYGEKKRFVTRKKDYTIEEVYEIYKQGQNKLNT